MEYLGGMVSLALVGVRLHVAHFHSGVSSWRVMHLAVSARVRRVVTIHVSALCLGHHMDLATGALLSLNVVVDILNVRNDGVLSRRELIVRLAMGLWSRHLRRGHPLLRWGLLGRLLSGARGPGNLVEAHGD